MADDLLDDLAFYIINEVRMPTQLIVTVMCEIEGLRAEIDLKGYRVDSLKALIVRLREQIKNLEEARHD